MDFKTMLVVFGSVLLAELGDKTQLATVLFASREQTGIVSVFVGASLALIFSTAIAVTAGAALARYVDPRYLTWAAGAGFIVIGTWILWRA